jgi:2-polyprenyl-6-methoxyphenol hydroxylase-like FAD-dependent oxidoreductase
MAVAVEEYEVVVVGAGPGGLASAITLGSYGIETLVVERRTSGSTLPRATVASTATMELLRRWGLEPAAWERSIDVEWQAWACPTLAAADQGEAIDVGLPTRAQAALVSPTRPACIAQDELEPLLEGQLGSIESVRLERGVELIGLEPSGDGAYLLALAGPGGRRRRVRASYLVGADGVRSTVRDQLAIRSDASDGLADGLAVLFRGPAWELVGEHRYGIYFLTVDSEGTSFIPAGKPDRWILGMHSTGTTGDVDRVDAEQASQWIRAAAGHPGMQVKIERVLAVRYGTSLAESFRHGNAFLIGDAAHRVTPRGGTGLNTAIHDGFDVGWKLAWALRGWGGDDLLSSYERERRPVAEFNMARSARSDGSILGAGDGLAADIGARIAHVWVERDGTLFSTLDLLGEGLTYFVGPDSEGSLPNRAAGSPPVIVQRVDAIAARGLGLSAAGSVLVRPDGRPVALWNGEPADRTTLRRAIASAGGPAVPVSNIPDTGRVVPRTHIDAALIAGAGSR